MPIVGTRKTPCFFICPSAARSASCPCSIESTPAASALRMLSAEEACAATLRRALWASSTMTFISSTVSVGASHSA